MEMVAEKQKPRQYEKQAAPDSVEAFEQWEAEQSGDENYEFYHGAIIQKPGMKQLEIFLVAFLMKCFRLTKAEEEGGTLVSEIDVFIDGQRKRIADLAFFNKQQILSTAKGNKEVPSFAIELLSDSESFKHIQLKVDDYFDAGVKLVWYISPDTKRIFAFTPQNKVQVFVEGDIATAAPALPDFTVEINKLFTPA